MLTPDDIARVRAAMLAIFPEAAEAFWFVSHNSLLPQLRGRMGERVIYLDDAFILMHIGRHERYITNQYLEEIADVWNNRNAQ